MSKKYYTEDEKFLEWLEERVGIVSGYDEICEAFDTCTDDAYGKFNIYGKEYSASEILQNTGDYEKEINEWMVKNNVDEEGDVYFMLGSLATNLYEAYGLYEDYAEVQGEKSS